MFITKKIWLKNQEKFYAEKLILNFIYTLKNYDNLRGSPRTPGGGKDRTSKI